jgi:hypothetical protein
MAKTNKISITRALTKLKTLDSKIKKEISNNCYVTVSVGGKISEHSQCNAKASFQAVQDLINFRDNLKSEVAKSNAVTNVTVAGKEMTVVEAIESKNSIGYKVELLKELKRQLADKRYQIEDVNSDAERRLDRLIESSVGSDKTKAKDEVEAITKTFLQRNEAKLVDDLGIEKVIKELEDDIQEFVDDVDIALSESNSRTYIEV